MSNSADPSAAAAAAAMTSTPPPNLMSQLQTTPLGDSNDASDRKDQTHNNTSKKPLSHKSTSKSSSRIAHTRKDSAISRADVVHFVHRLAICGAALFYAISCLASVTGTVRLLMALGNKPVLYAVEDSHVMRSFIGTTTIRQSPLVVTALSDSTAPITDTLFLHSSLALNNSGTAFSFSPCANMSTPLQRIYSNSHLRLLYSALATSLVYNITMFAELELVAPVVDCSIATIARGDATFIWLHYLVSSTANKDEMYVIPLRMSAIEYSLPDQAENGPAGVATLAFINNLQVTSVMHSTVTSIGFPFERMDFRACAFEGVTADGSWALRTIPQDPDHELAKRVHVAGKSGSFLKAEYEQSNINNALWVLSPTSPTNTLVQLQFTSKAVLHNSWGWVHLVELYLGLDVLLNVVIVLVIAVHNARAGRLWLGDAFVAVSSTLPVRGAVVVVSLFIDKFWALIVFCWVDASVVAAATHAKANVPAPLVKITAYEAVTHADLLSLYLSITGLFGMVCHERVDPLVAIACFELAYRNRRAILAWFPSLLRTAVAFADKIDAASTQAPVVGQQHVTPMQFRTTAEMTSATASTIASVLVAIPLSLTLIIVYIGLCKVYWHYYPDKLLVLQSSSKTTMQSKNTLSSENEHALLLAQKQQYTRFELATGAQLENRFGLMAHYSTCVFVKGAKFASADGIYSNGFVIANGKFLLQARDVVWVALMKLVNSRFTSVYVYEMVDGNAVQQKARLVYPDTLTWRDLALINITILN